MSQPITQAHAAAKARNEAADAAFLLALRALATSLRTDHPSAVQLVLTEGDQSAHDVVFASLHDADGTELADELTQEQDDLIRDLEDWRLCELIGLVTVDEFRDVTIDLAQAADISTPTPLVTPLTRAIPLGDVLTGPSDLLDGQPDEYQIRVRRRGNTGTRSDWIDAPRELVEIITALLDSGDPRDGHEPGSGLDRLLELRAIHQALLDDDDDAGTHREWAPAAMGDVMAALFGREVES